MPTAPDLVKDHYLNFAGQNVLSYGSWVLTVVLLVVAWRLGRKEKNGVPFYVLAVLCSMVGALAEPLYDVMFSLYFYAPDGMHRTFTAFGIPQPVWAYSGYAVLYAAPAVYINRQLAKGKLTRRNLIPVIVVIDLMSCVFEMIGINLNTYTYWGPHVLRVFKYPLVIGMLETAQVMCFSIAIAELRKRARSTLDLLAVFAIFPVTMLGVNFGAGAAVILAIHLDDPSTAIVTLGTLVSMGCALVLIRLASSFVPETASAPAAAAAAAPRNGGKRAGKPVGAKARG